MLCRTVCSPLFFLTIEKTEGSLILKERAQTREGRVGKTVDGKGKRVEMTVFSIILL